VRQIYILLLAVSLTGCIAGGLLSPTSQTSTPATSQSAETEVEELDVVAAPPTPALETTVPHPVTQDATQLPERHTGEPAATRDEAPDEMVETPNSTTAATMAETSVSLVSESAPDSNGEQETAGLSVAVSSQTSEHLSEPQDSTQTAAHPLIETPEDTSNNSAASESSNRPYNADLHEVDSSNSTQCPCPRDSSSNSESPAYEIRPDGLQAQIGRILFDPDSTSGLSDELLKQAVFGFFGGLFSFFVGAGTLYFGGIGARRQALANELIYQTKQYRKFKDVRPAQNGPSYRVQRIEDIQRVLETARQETILTKKMKDALERYETAIEAFHNRTDANDDGIQQGRVDWINITGVQVRTWKDVILTLSDAVGEIFPSDKRSFANKISKIKYIRAPAQAEQSFWGRLFGSLRVFSPFHQRAA